ncbi:hypothetical protein [Haloarchaeobius baliensis]|uniref:hypothetical protein n=1 Tax=Haloarchaeobius baliensis TaxID=1670458 RepID=UPI003F882FFA
MDDADSSFSGAAVGGIAGAVGATVAFSTVSGPFAIAGVTAGITLVLVVVLALAFDVDFE